MAIYRDTLHQRSEETLGGKIGSLPDEISFPGRAVEGGELPKRVNALPARRTALRPGTSARDGSMIARDIRPRRAAPRRSNSPPAAACREAA